MDILEKFQDYYANNLDPGYKRLSKQNYEAKANDMNAVNNLNSINANKEINNINRINNANDNSENNPDYNYNNIYFSNANDTEENRNLHNLNEEIFNIQRKNINNYLIEHRYSLGINIDLTSNKNICYHKTQKWFAYIFDSKIILEDFSIEENRRQIFLDDSKYRLSAVKISANNNYLMAYSTHSFHIEKKKDKEFDFSDLNSYNVFEEESLNTNTNNNNNNLNNLNDINTTNITTKVNPYIFIWDIKDFNFDDEIPAYKNITKVSIKHSKILDCEFSPQNNLCVFSSTMTIHLLDFIIFISQFKARCY